MRTTLIAVATLTGWAVLACSPTPPPVEPWSPRPSHDPGAPAPLTSAPLSTSAGGAAAAPSATASVSAPPPAEQASVPAEPDSCPTGMVLVEGDYCTEVAQTCLIEWWAPQNKKRVCEQFKPETRCVGTKVAKRFCIDKYAWPNVAGARPEVMNTFYQAQVKCAAMGKRMCSESEWTFACEGPEMKPFPYGYVRDPRKCNGDHRWDGPRMKRVGKRDAKELARLWRGVPSGSQPECVSDFGVHDLPANNDEVVAGESYKAKFSSVNTGGPWYSGVRNQCRPKVYTHGEDFYYYFLGFRCCSAPDGGDNEPRTNKQIRDGWSFERVERLAGFTTEQMKQVLAVKERGGCDCQNNQLEGVTLPRRPAWLCRTMCGTLLGPDAHDADDSTRVPHHSRDKISQ